jgi:LacI family transcriptional regulator
MRYVPNSTARSLKTSRSYTIGIIFEEITQQGLQHPLFSKILESFKSVVEAQGYDILFLAKNMGLQNGSYYQHSIRKQVDAILVLCADFNSDSMTELYASELPLVVIDYSEQSALTVTSNNELGTAYAVDHLASLGHRKIAHIHGDKESYIGGLRKLAFEQALAAQGLTLPEAYVIEGPSYNREDGYRAMQQFLTLNERPTAVFCASDLLAIGAIQAVRDAGLSVPHDVSIVGFDGIDLGQMITPTLTTIKQNTLLMGQMAAQNILDMIDQTQPKMRGESISVATELVVGDSTSQLKDSV